MFFYFALFAGMALFAFLGGRFTFESVPFMPILMVVSIITGVFLWRHARNVYGGMYMRVGTAATVMLAVVVAILHFFGLVEAGKFSDSAPRIAFLVTFFSVLLGAWIAACTAPSRESPHSLHRNAP